MKVKATSEFTAVICQMLWGKALVFTLSFLFYFNMQQWYSRVHLLFGGVGIITLCNAAASGRRRQQHTCNGRRNWAAARVMKSLSCGRASWVFPVQTRANTHFVIQASHALFFYFPPSPPHCFSKTFYSEWRKALNQTLEYIYPNHISCHVNSVQTCHYKTRAGRGATEIQNKANSPDVTNKLLRFFCFYSILTKTVTPVEITLSLKIPTYLDFSLHALRSSFPCCHLLLLLCARLHISKIAFLLCQILHPFFCLQPHAHPTPLSVGTIERKQSKEKTGEWAPRAGSQWVRGRVLMQRVYFYGKLLRPDLGGS